MRGVLSVLVPVDAVGERLDRFVATLPEVASRAEAERLLASGAVRVDEVQPAGKPRMTAADWVRGRGVRAGQRFT